MRFARLSLALAVLAASATTVAAENRCLVKGKMQDQSFELKSCAAALYDNKGATIWFTEKPLPAETLDTFHLNSYADLSGTSMSLSLCPGGNKSVVDPKAATNVAFEVEHAATPMVAQSFLFDPGKTPDLKIEKLSGELKAGGRLVGKMKVSTKLDRGQAYSWDADFDVTFPAKLAAAGPGCGD